MLLRKLNNYVANEQFHRLSLGLVVTWRFSLLEPVIIFTSLFFIYFADLLVLLHQIFTAHMYFVYQLYITALYQTSP